MSQFMILPSRDPANIRVVRIPVDFERGEAFRHITGMIADLESRHSPLNWEDLSEHLESQGYEVVNAVLGPAWD